MVSTGDDVFVVFNGVRIAKHDHPKTPQAGQLHVSQGRR